MAAGDRGHIPPRGRWTWNRDAAALRPDRHRVGARVAGSARARARLFLPASAYPGLGQRRDRRARHVRLHPVLGRGGDPAGAARPRVGRSAQKHRGVAAAGLLGSWHRRSGGRRAGALLDRGRAELRHGRAAEGLALAAEPDRDQRGDDHRRRDATSLVSAAWMGARRAGRGPGWRGGHRRRRDDSVGRLLALAYGDRGRARGRPSVVASVGRAGRDDRRLRGACRAAHGRHPAHGRLPGDGSWRDHGAGSRRGLASGNRWQRAEHVHRRPRGRADRRRVRDAVRARPVAEHGRSQRPRAADAKHRVAADHRGARPTWHPDPRVVHRGGDDVLRRFQEPADRGVCGGGRVGGERGGACHAASAGVVRVPEP